MIIQGQLNCSDLPFIPLSPVSFSAPALQFHDLVVCSIALFSDVLKHSHLLFSISFFISHICLVQFLPPFFNFGLLFVYSNVCITCLPSFPMLFFFFSLCVLSLFPLSRSTVSEWISAVATASAGTKRELAPAGLMD